MTPTGCLRTPAIWSDRPAGVPTPRPSGNSGTHFRPHARTKGVEPRLSDRELEVLEMIGAGKQVKAIA